MTYRTRNMTCGCGRALAIDGCHQAFGPQGWGGHKFSASTAGIGAPLLSPQIPPKNYQNNQNLMKHNVTTTR